MSSDLLDLLRAMRSGQQRTGACACPGCAGRSAGPDPLRTCVKCNAPRPLSCKAFCKDCDPTIDDSKCGMCGLPSNTLDLKPASKTGFFFCSYACWDKAVAQNHAEMPPRSRKMASSMEFRRLCARRMVAQKTLNDSTDLHGGDRARARSRAYTDLAGMYADFAAYKDARAAAAAPVDE